MPVPTAPARLLETEGLQVQQTRFDRSRFGHDALRGTRCVVASPGRWLSGQRPGALESCSFHVGCAIASARSAMRSTSKRKPQACRGFQGAECMKTSRTPRCPRRFNVIPNHESRKARIANSLRCAPERSSRHRQDSNVSVLIQRLPILCRHGCRNAD
jgi:hypothetical protein